MTDRDEPTTLRLADPGHAEPTSQGADEPGAGRSWRRRLTGRAATLAAFAAAGLLFVASGISADGIDLRAERQTDLTGLVQAQAQRNQELAAQVSALREEVDTLTEQVPATGTEEAEQQVTELAPPAGMTAVSGDGVQVTLDDAPASARSDEVDADALIVHQQDIQAVVNALWAGGAEAMSIQGQRVISTSAIRCVGNSVVLHGVPYPPPYEISAIGPVSAMSDALDSSSGVGVYREYVEEFGLGYEVEVRSDITIEEFEGSLDLKSADVLAG